MVATATAVSAVYGFNADMGGKVDQLDPPGMSSRGQHDLAAGILNYIEVDRDGTRSCSSCTTRALRTSTTRTAERVNYVTNIDFDTPDGSMHARFNRWQRLGPAARQQRPRRRGAWPYPLPRRLRTTPTRRVRATRTSREMVRAQVRSRRRRRGRRRPTPALPGVSTSCSLRASARVMSQRPPPPRTGGRGHPRHPSRGPSGPVTA